MRALQNVDSSRRNNREGQAAEQNCSCMRAQRQVVAQQRREEQLGPDAVPEGLPHGLTIKSLRDYKVDWSRYVQFVTGRQQQAHARP